MEWLPQAIAIAISPIPIALVIVVLVSERGRANGPAFAVGWVLGIAATTLVAGWVAEGASVATDPDASEGGGLVQIALGALFWFLAFRQWRGRPRPGAEIEIPRVFAVIERASVAKAFGIGLAAASANPKNLPLTISAGLAIATSGAYGGTLVVGSLAFAVAASAVVLVLVIATFVLGDRIRGPLDRLRGFLLANNATILTVVFAILGGVMIGSGLQVLD